MDIQSLLIGLGVFLVSALLIWIITSLTVQERPFEERMEQQRQIERDLLLLEGKHGSQTAGSKKDKTKKKPNKKLKTGSEIITGAMQNIIQEEKLEKETKSKSSKMVELEIEPVVIETALDEAPAVDATRKKPFKTTSAQVGAAKPILHNRDEKSAVHKSGEAPEVIHHRIVPKDAVELKHEHEKQKGPQQNQPGSAGKSDVNKSAEGKVVGHVATANAEVKAVTVEIATGLGTATNGTSAKPKKQKVPREADVLAGDDVKIPQMSAALATVPAAGEPNQKKKNKSNNIGAASVPLSNDDGVGLVTNVVSAKPSSTDVTGTRKLPGMDAAVTSAGGEGLQKSPNDAIALLVKQLEDKTKEIADEKQRTAAATDVVNKLQLELGDLRQKLSVLAKQNSDQLTSQHQEQVALSGHIKQLETNTQLMRNQIESLKAQLVESHNELQRTNAEKMHLVAKSQQLTSNDKALEEARQKIKIMEDALKANAQSYNSVDSARKMLDTKNKQLEKEVAQLNSLLGSQRLAQMQNETPEIQKAAAAHIKTLSLELEQAKSVAQRQEKDLIARQEEIKMSENKLHEINRQKCEAEGRLRLADAHVTELANELKKKDGQLQDLSAQLNEALGHLKIANEKLVGGGVEGGNIEAIQCEADLLESVEETGNLCSENRDFLQNGEPSLGISQREEIEKLEEQFRSKSLECMQLKGEVEIISRDNEVLRECAKKCDEMKSNLQSLKSQLKDMEQERADNESRLKQKLTELDSAEAKLNQKNTDFANMENRLHQLELELTTVHRQSAQLLESASPKAEDLESQLHQKVAELANVREELSQKEQARSDLEAKLHQKEAQLEASESRFKSLEESRDTECEKALNAEHSQQLIGLQTALDQKNASVADLESHLATSRAAFSDLEARLHRKETECKELELLANQTKDELKNQLSSITDERNQLKSTVDQLQQELQSLKQVEPKSDAGDGIVGKRELDSLKAANEEQMQKVTCLLDQLKVEKKLSENLSGLLHRLFPDSHVNQDNVRQPDWLVSFEKDALHHVHKEVDSSSDLERLKSELDQAKDAETKLAAQVQHYKNVLSDTELILKKLQEAVETEDLKNQQTLQKLQSAENQLHAKNIEVDTLHHEMRSMHKNTECYIADTTPAVEHAECVLRRGASPEKQRTMTELTGTATE